MKAFEVDYQYGLSMVELLVALAVSSFLILGITQVYIDNKRSYMFQQSQSNNQENTRFAELTLNTLINKAGYRRAPDQLIEDAFPKSTSTDDCEVFIEGAAVAAFKPKSGTKEIGFCIRYQPASSTDFDCQGNTVKTVARTNIDKPFIKTAQEELVTLAIKFVPNADLVKGSLQCKNLTGTAPAFEELIDGVADINFQYATSEGDLFERKLKNNPWSTNPTGLVRAVRYSILLTSRANQRDGESVIYNDWVNAVSDTTNKARIQAGDNQRVYQLAGSTQTLRNMMP